MQNAEAILNIIRERGRRVLTLDEVYRVLYNPELYLIAYDKIRRNDGAMTPGITPETPDGMSEAKIMTIIDLIRQEKYRWMPVRRTYIPKKNNPTKKRPLGLPTWSDKLLQEVMRMILEAYYEPQFSPLSHGFRPGRGCHTALDQIRHTWTGTVWFLEGDIKGCFDNIDHTMLMNILREKIQDNRFLRLTENCLTAGYLEDWRYNATYSGTPQGGVISPILSNIYLDKLDQYVTHDLIPVYTRGKERRNNPAYRKLVKQRAKELQEGNCAAARVTFNAMMKTPYSMHSDPEYRRLRYIRYADDFLLGFVGPKDEAEQIKQNLRQYLHDTLALEMSEDKTLITHGRTNAARFLGYEILTIHNNRLKRTHSHGELRILRRTVNGRIGLGVPKDVVRNYVARYQKKGKPCSRCELIADNVYSILQRYQAELRGIAQYYQLAYNRAKRMNDIYYAAQSSLLVTLANKFHSSKAKMYRKYATVTQTESGPRKALQVVVPRENKPPLVATFGGLSFGWIRRVEHMQDEIGKIGTIYVSRRGELIDRLQKGKCELCGSTNPTEVHHIRKLADVQKAGRAPQPLWKERMAARRRKTLVVCSTCHDDIHAGRWDGKRIG